MINSFSVQLSSICIARKQITHYHKALYAVMSRPYNIIKRNSRVPTIRKHLATGERKTEITLEQNQTQGGRPSALTGWVERERERERNGGLVVIMIMIIVILIYSPNYNVYQREKFKNETLNVEMFPLIQTGSCLPVYSQRPWDLHVSLHFESRVNYWDKVG